MTIMRIEYENKFKDILLFSCVHQFMSPVLQGFFIIGCAYFFIIELSDNNVLISMFIAIFWYLFLWAFQFCFNAVYLYSRKNNSVLTGHIVEIQEDAFFEETKFNKSFFYWPGVIKAVSRPGFVGVYVTPQMAHVIPNRAFSSSAKRAEFIKLLKEKIHASAAKV
jgi:hypothetical protein